MKTSGSNPLKRERDLNNSHTSPPSNYTDDRIDSIFSAKTNSADEVEVSKSAAKSNPTSDSVDNEAQYPPSISNSPSICNPSASNFSSPIARSPFAFASSNTPNVPISLERRNSSSSDMEEEEDDVDGRKPAAATTTTSVEQESVIVDLLYSLNFDEGDDEFTYGDEEVEEANGEAPPSGNTTNLRHYILPSPSSSNCPQPPGLNGRGDPCRALPFRKGPTIKGEPKIYEGIKIVNNLNFFPQTPGGQAFPPEALAELIEGNAFIHATLTNNLYNNPDPNNTIFYPHNYNLAGGILRTSYMYPLCTKQDHGPRGIRGVWCFPAGHIKMSIGHILKKWGAYLKATGGGIAVLVLPRSDARIEQFENHMTGSHFSRKTNPVFSRTRVFVEDKDFLLISPNKEGEWLIPEALNMVEMSSIFTKPFLTHEEIRARRAAYNATYRASSKGKAVQATYQASSKGKATIATWNASSKGKAANKAASATYRASSNGKAVKAAYNASSNGKAVNKAASATYQASSKGKAASAAYNASSKGKAANKAASATYRASSNGKAVKAAYNASSNGKAVKAAYKASSNGKASIATYNASSKRKESRATYNAKNRESINQKQNARNASKRAESKAEKQKEEHAARQTGGTLEYRIGQVQIEVHNATTERTPVTSALLMRILGRWEFDAALLAPAMAHLRTLRTIGRVNGTTRATVCLTWDEIVQNILMEGDYGFDQKDGRWKKGAFQLVLAAIASKKDAEAARAAIAAQNAEDAVAHRRESKRRK
ncbi:hypothetical protein TrCOL_g8870 [Triparma columacea]|uniref:Uncharacterized protein n=1 Tax=Triparma columacea TaxID=722753 RepID=A0A9W7LGH1_9STRA|nr:hypothetical protein TrCOL_g8870 [Triparma columacea]